MDGTRGVPGGLLVTVYTRRGPGFKTFADGSRIQKHRDPKGSRWVGCVQAQPVTVTLVMWGFTPSYQYRKPSISMVWPTSRFFTALYTSVVLSHR